jgi:hypothetical protein
VFATRPSRPMVGQHESRFLSFGSLHEAAASSALSSSPEPCVRKDRGSFRRPVQPASSSWPVAVCTSGRRIVLSAVRRIGCNQYVPRSPVRPDLVNRWRGRYRRSLPMRFLPFSISVFLPVTPQPPRNACRPSRSGRALRRACAPPPHAPAWARAV